MSDKAAAAQKWAEAKSCLDAADLALTAAKDAYAKAEDAEFHAWQALEALAGRVAVKPQAPVTDTYASLLRTADQARRPSDAIRHSLPSRPIG